MAASAALSFLDASDSAPPEQADLYCKGAALYWERFYRRHDDRFFKDRHYLDREFPELGAGAFKLLEVGCGVGNTAFPLLEMNRHATVYACDFSQHAVKLVRANPLYDPTRLTAFQADITQDALTGTVPAGCIDFCTMVFVLSALAPATMGQAIQNVASTLVPGKGRVFVRDYAEGDLAQTRFQSAGRPQKLMDNFYVRGDGTCAYYFTLAHLRALFEAEGFECEDVHVHEKAVDNRKQRVSMHRRWIQAVFRYTGRRPLTTPPRSSSTTAGAVPGHMDRLDPAPNGRCGEDAAGLSEAPQDLSRAASQAAADAHGLAQRGPSSQAGEIGPERQPPDAHFDERCQPSCSPSGCSLEASQRSQDPSHAESPAHPHSTPQLPAGASDHLPEWEQDPAHDSELAGLFGESNGPEAGELVSREVELGRGVRVRVASLSREHSHTQPHTGLMLWDSSERLAALLLRCPAMLEGRRVLELGCGASPLCTLAAVRWARRVVATDGSRPALGLLAENLHENASRFIIERVEVRQLAWHDPEQLARIRAAYPAGFDLIFGADVVYVQEAVPLLFATAAQLLSRQPHARLLLCHITRRVGEAHIVEDARRAGLELAAWDPQLEEAAQQAGIVGSAFRLLVFARMTEGS